MLEKTKLNVVLLIGIDQIKFDYRDIKKVVKTLFADDSVLILADDFENQEFPNNQEDFLIEVDGFKYDEEFNSNFYSASISIENLATEKTIEMQLSQKGHFTAARFFDLLEKLVKLTKYSIEEDIF